MSSIYVVTNYHLRRSDEELPEVIPCACLTRSEVTGSHVTFLLTFFSYYFSDFFPVLFSYFFPVIFSPVLFSRIFSNVATLEIQRFKISVSCFSSSCHYNSSCSLRDTLLAKLRCQNVVTT
jgi:hypothetical protein